MPPTAPSVVTPLPGASVDPEVALPWVISLRWVAAGSQVVTVLIADSILGLRLPLLALSGVIAVTFLTNLGLWLWLGTDEPARPRLLGAILTLDTLLLTALLALSGGPQNPFALLYVIHVALASVALSAGWAWWIVAVTAACYALLHPFHVSLQLETGTLGPNLSTAGQGVAILIVAANVAFFTAGVSQALRRREEDLRLAGAQLARNEWLASLAALAAGIAHELGTPLGTIAIVSKELELAAERQSAAGMLEDARLIRAQVERCRRILDRLGVLDREGLGNAPAPLGLAQLLAHLRDDQQQAAFDVQIAEEVDSQAMVHPDAAHALQPLLKNALDATEGQGRVSLLVGRAGGGWRFEVQDDGPGMSVEVLEQARRPFFTTKEHGRGMGLGLYLVDLIAQRHGGRVQLSSAPGEGVRATLEFPDSPQRQSHASE
jgi:two-component system sensor histidine kinase RegB